MEITKGANRRALSLLRRNLTSEQLADWRESRTFEVVTWSGRRRWRIDADSLAGNICLVECYGKLPVVHEIKVNIGSKICAHINLSRNLVPLPDNALAQKLLLESEGGERRLLRIARIYGARQAIRYVEGGWIIEWNVPD